MTAKATDKLAAAAVKISADELRGGGPKTEFLQFRVSKKEKESIQQAAASLDLQVSEYLLRLHELVDEKLKKD